MAKRQKRKRSVFLPLLAVLLVLALAGTVLFSAFREKIDRWEYPQRYEEYVEYYAGKYGIDPMILYAFIRTESNFDPNVDSDAGARGLMQITEVTFDWIKTKIAPTENLTFDDLYDPETNIRFGSYFVSYCLLTPLRGAERGCNGLCGGMLTNQFIKRRARNSKRFCKLCLVQLAVQIALILCGEIVRFDLFAAFELALCFCNSDTLALAFQEVAALKLIDCTNHCKHQSSCWGAGIDVLFITDKMHTLCL